MDASALASAAIWTLSDPSTDGRRAAAVAPGPSVRLPAAMVERHSRHRLMLLGPMVTPRLSASVGPLGDGHESPQPLPAAPDQPYSGHCARCCSQNRSPQQPQRQPSRPSRNSAAQSGSRQPMIRS